MSEFKYTFNLETTASGDGAEKTKAGLDAVTQSANEAAEAQVKASSDVADALKQEQAALDAHVQQINGLVDAVNRYNEALAAGDQEATISGLQEIKQGMDAMAQSSGEIPPELEEINAELDNLDEKVSGKKSFEKLSNQANGTSKSLKHIEKLQVAEAIGNIVQQARSAGKSFADLGKEGESATDTALDAAEAVGDLASGVAAGFASGGLIGGAIALVTAGLSFFSAKAAEAKKEIDATFSDITTDFGLTREEADLTAQAVVAYGNAYKTASDAISNNLTSLKQTLAIEQTKADLAERVAQAEAKLAKSKIDLEIEKGVENGGISAEEGQRQKDAIDSGLADKSAKKQVEDIKRRMEENAAEIKANTEQWSQLNDYLADAKELVEQAGDIEEIKQKGDGYTDDSNVAVTDIESEIERATADFDLRLGSGQLSNDSIEEPLKRLLEKYKGKNDVQLRGDFGSELLTLLESFQSDEEKKGTSQIELERLAQNLTVYARRVEELKGELSEAEKAQAAFSNAESQFKSSEKNIKGKAVDLTTRKKQLEAELEVVKKIQAIEKKDVTTRQQVSSTKRENKRDALAKRAAEKKQKEIEREEGKAGQLVGSALDKASGVAGLTKGFKSRIAKAQAANADGTDSAEMKEVMSILNTLVSAAEKRSGVDGGLLSALQSQNAKVQAQDRKVSQLDGELKKFKQLYINNRRK